MTRIPGILAVVLLAIARPDAQEVRAAKSMDQAATLLVAQEHLLLNAVATADRPSFQSLISPDGVWTTKEGFVPMVLLVDGLDDFQVTRWDIVNPHVTRLDADSAIVLYTWTGTGRFHNQPLAGTMLASTVWTRRNGK